jgi:hypothetical protein
MYMISRLLDSSPLAALTVRSLKTWGLRLRRTAELFSLDLRAYDNSSHEVNG